MKWMRVLVMGIAIAAGSEEASAQARNEVAIGVGIVAGEVSYARRVGDSRLSVGAGVWGAWEPPSSFDREVFEPIGLSVFGRYRPAPWVHADVGLTAARYLYADDCSSCSGTFAGVRTAVMVGRGMVFVGPELALGRADDERDGPEFGMMWGAQVRLLLGWGR